MAELIVLNKLRLFICLYKCVRMRVRGTSGSLFNFEMLLIFLVYLLLAEFLSGQFSSTH